jgi:acyl carrier protein phosphodiesterase
LNAYFSSQFSQLPFNNIESQINASFSNVSFYYGGCLKGMNLFISQPGSYYMLDIISPNRGHNCLAQWNAFQDMQNITPIQNQTLFNLNQSIQQFYDYVNQQDITNILNSLKAIQTQSQQLESSYNQIVNDYTQFTNFCLSNNTNNAVTFMFFNQQQQNENITCFYQSFLDQDLKNIESLSQQGNNYNIQNMQNQIYTQTIQRVNAAQATIEKNQSINTLQSAEAQYQKIKNFYAGTSVSISFISAYEQQAQNSLNSSNFSSAAIDNFSQQVQQLYGISNQFNLTSYSLSNSLNVINTAIERVGRSDPRIQQAQNNYTLLYNQYKTLSQQLSNGGAVTNNQLQAIQTQTDSLSKYAASLQPPENQFGWIQIIAVIVIVIVIIEVLFYFKKFKKEPPKITDLKTGYSLNSDNASQTQLKK